MREDIIHKNILLNDVIVYKVILSLSYLCVYMFWGKLYKYVVHFKKYIGMSHLHKIYFTVYANT